MWRADARIDRDAIGGGAGGGGQRLAPGEMSVIHQRRPIDHANHDGCARSAEHVPDGLEVIVDGLGGWHQPAQEGMT